MSYPEKIQKIFEELDSGVLTANTEESIKRILMATVEIYDMPSSTEYHILEDALENRDYSYPL